MKVLIVGLGSIARKHINALLTIDPCTKIFALRSNFNSKDEPNVQNVYSIDFLDSTSVDFIIISTPTYLHYQNILDLVKYKVPLFIEKPLFDSLESNEILNTVKVENLLTYVACNLRFLDAINYVRDNFLNSGNLVNEVNVYSGSYLPSWRPTQDFRENYSADSKRGGGVHLDLIHEVDYIYWLFGRPELVTKTLRSESSLKISSIDYANYALEYTGFTVSIVLNYYRRDSKRTLEILMEDYTVLVDLISNKVYKNNELIFESSQSILNTYELQLRYFIDNLVINRKNGFNTINEAFEVLKISLHDIKR